MSDPREGNAIYYDLDESPLDDIPFYINRIAADQSVLELGCGTGRTLIPLATSCKEIVGVDYSKDMIERCLAKIPESLKYKCQVMTGDITRLRLDRKFDLIIAPYRVMQALETDSEVRGFLNSIANHLSPEGSCILNVFNPNRPKDEMLKSWPKVTETLCWEKKLEDGSTVAHFEFYEKVTTNPLVLFPHLIYRRYKDGQKTDELVQKIKMRCYYPDEFRSLLETSGFEITEAWGGYKGEKYGEGRELVLRFCKPVV